MEKLSFLFISHYFFTLLTSLVMNLSNRDEESRWGDKLISEDIAKLAV
jgi:hypothetical protein